MPQAQLRVGQVKGIVPAPPPTVCRSVVAGGALVVLMALLTLSMSSLNILLRTAATYAMVMLSLVLTGYGGHVSLAQFTFAASAHWPGPSSTRRTCSASSSPPSSRPRSEPWWRFRCSGLTGLYPPSARSPGVLMDKLVFQASFAFGFNGSLSAERHPLAS